MRITILYFAGVREALGTASESVETEAATVAALRSELRRRGAPWADQLADGRNVRTALNHAMVDGDAILFDGAELAFFPPVTGG